MEQPNIWKMLWEVIRGRKSSDDFKKFMAERRRISWERRKERMEHYDEQWEALRAAFSVAPFEVYMIVTATSGVYIFLTFKTIYEILSFLMG